MAAPPALWLLLLALGSAPSGGRGTDQVPLLAWSTDGSLFGSQAAPSEGHVLSGLQMAAYLNPALAKGPKTIVLFLQDKLSVDDFTAYGGVYGNRQDSAFPSLQEALDSSASSLVLPAVDWHAATSLLPTLQMAVGAGPLYVDQLTIRELRLNASVPSLLVVNLPYTSSSILMRPKEALTANDNIVGKVLEVLKREGVPFTAVLTGSRPSRVSGGDADQWGGSPRRLLEVGAEVEAGTPHPPLAYNESGRPCILLWASSLGLSRAGSPSTDLTNLTFSPQPSVSLADSLCNNHSAQLVLSYSNVEKVGDVKITFKLTNRWYVVSGRSWFTLDQVEVQAGADLTAFNVTEVYAPSGFSFSCYALSDQPRSGALLRPSAPASSPTAWSLHVTNIQIQAFGVKGVSFSYASDCASFFTPAIWMGLLTSLLMLFILTYGLHMLTSLKTMDRFDDPKGPSISVPQTE